MQKVFIDKKALVSGATSLFRNRILFDTILNLLAKNKKSEPIRVLFHSCSIGAEVYSFLIQNELKGNGKLILEVEATDRFSEYVEAAKSGVYRQIELKHLTNEEKNFFAPRGDGSFEVIPSMRDKVTFLGPSDFRTFHATKHYDVIFMLNSLCYVSRSDQAKVINSISGYCDFIFSVSAFHPATIARDMITNGFVPYSGMLKEIHESWDFRIRPKDTFLKKRIYDLKDFLRVLFPPKDGALHVESSIPPFEAVNNFEYKYCSIFLKKDFKPKL